MDAALALAEAEGKPTSVTRVWAAGGVASGRRDRHRRWREGATVVRGGGGEGTLRASFRRVGGARDHPWVTARPVPGAMVSYS